MIDRRVAVLAATLAVLAGAGPRAASAPAWLKDAAALPDPALDRDAGAVVLVDDIAIEINADGRERTVTRYAVRVRKADGRSAARISEIYLFGAGHVRDLKAWTIRPSGQVVEYGRDAIVDLAVVNDDVYNDVRRQTVGAGRDAEPGSVFGAEVTTDERTVFTNFEWQLQDVWPVLVSRRSIKTPEQWTVKSVTFNHAPIVPVANGRVTQWEMRDLAGIAQEPAMPALAELVPRLAATVLPPADAKLPLLDSWSSVSRWLSGIQDPPAAVTEGIQAKSTALAGAETTPLAKVKTIGRYVQDVRYVSIQMGLAQGGGYQPRPAADLLVKNYGDCKDKANLLRSLLAAAGIRAYMVGVHLGDPAFVREDWPSPTQFNHAILAVSVDSSVEAPAVLRDPRLGALLIVDATDDQTPVGDLSLELQGSLGLIVSASDGALVRLPVTPADRNLIERRWTARLDVKGALTGSLVETRLGDEAAAFRRYVSELGAAGFARAVEQRIAATVRGARVDRFEPKSAADRFDLTLSFTAPAYAQALQPALFLVSPPAFGADGPDLTSPTRRSPIRLDAAMIKETIDLTLPAGFVVDEMPATTSLDAAFGRFTSTARSEGDRVVIEHSLVLTGGLVPADHVSEVRQFFERARAARTSPIILKKEP